MLGRRADGKAVRPEPLESQVDLIVKTQPNMLLESELGMLSMLVSLVLIKEY